MSTSGYTLDANIVRPLLRKDDRVVQRLRQLGILPLDQKALDKAAEIYASLRQRGELIEDADLLIAATAIVNDVVLVTNNSAHFARVSGLKTEDWLTNG